MDVMGRSLADSGCIYWLYEPFWDVSGLSVGGHSLRQLQLRWSYLDRAVLRPAAARFGWYLPDGPYCRVEPNLEDPLAAVLFTAARTLGPQHRLSPGNGSSGPIQNSV